MNWNTVFGIVCIVALFIPVGVILYNRFYTNRSLAALLVYFAMTATSNLLSLFFFDLPQNFQRYYALLNNYLDVPLMLTGLLFFCPGRQRQRLMHILIASFIGYEIVVSLIHGFTTRATVYILGPGFCIVLLYSFFLFVRQVKFSIVHRKNQGRTLMLASILFAYFCYSLIYYFYYIQKTPYTRDVFIIYFSASTVGSLLMATGIHLIRKRVKDLQSAQLTRKELAMFFGQ